MAPWRSLIYAENELKTFSLLIVLAPEKKGSRMFTSRMRMPFPKTLLNSPGLLAIRWLFFRLLWRSRSGAGLRLPEIWIGLDPFVGGIAHFRTEDEQIVLA